MPEDPYVQNPDITKVNNPGKSVYTGIFLTALSTLMYEILLTRIFSVTMGYHFAFMAISIAMFGMTVGAIIVYIYPQKFRAENLLYTLAKYSLLSAVTVILSFTAHLFVPFAHEKSIIGFAVSAFTYISISIPFVFSGICISLILTKFPVKVNRLYAADLAGASLGCILVVLVINISGGPTSVFITAFITALASLLFANNSDSKRIRSLIITFLILTGSFSFINTILFNNDNSLLRLYYSRGEYTEKPLYEKWNSFSRITISGDSTAQEVPFGWGLSDTYDRNQKVRQLMLNIDAYSTTVLTKFDGDLSKLFHLKYDVSNIVHYLRHDADVMIIGSGGGRDVISSLYFKQRSILGIEINKDMISALNNRYGDFTGHLDTYPNVKFVGDEARSYIQRSQQKFDIIQVSVIDNWTATSSGAFVFTENALYSLDTWKLLFDRLKDDGIITITRFYRIKPSEIYRIAAIASQTLTDAGITDPRRHIAILKCDMKERIEDQSGTGTILLSKKPFTAVDLKTIDSTCGIYKFQKVLTPNEVSDTNFALITSGGKKQEDFINNYPLNIKPPTDDNPFFFHLLYIKDFFSPSFIKEWDMEFNAKAIYILLSIFLIMLVLTILCIVVPLKLTSKKISLKGSAPLFIFFGAIGFGFMLIEISQIQRLNIFLGHPTYSLSVALFTLLLSSGIGSYFSGIKSSGTSGQIQFSSLIRLLILIIMLVIFGLFTPQIIAAFREYSTEIRILVAVLILFPLGFFMGIAFPLGMKAAGKNPAITPWLWGINGITSVFATAIAVLVAMAYGISASYWTGTILYAIAVVSFIYLFLRDFKLITRLI